MKRRLVILACSAGLASAPRVSAQVAAPPPQPISTQPLPQQVPAYAYVPPPASSKRSSTEITVLYGTAAAYGVGMGVWIGAEVGIEDPGLFLIAPAVLGVAAPIGVYLLDDPAMPRGLPAAIASGLVIGAGEGIGLASYQMVSSGSAEAWGFRGFSRATAIGATLGGVGGFALGYLQEPSPKSSLLTTSGVAWGAAIGAMFGYGASGAGLGYGLANDSAALGGLIGFNVGLAAAAGLSTVYIPSYRALSYMWIGAGIGAAASLPVYLLYVGEDRPPAKRGLVFSGTTTTLGIVAGALLAGTGSESASSERSPQFAHLDYILPMPTANGALFTLGGRLE
ncbi:MAG TPA: hypothetical protein VER12_04105 [Polyangiaceae bacterium]|nr:hypothetical protein [Polyangiaceae bacterium]